MLETLITSRTRVKLLLRFFLNPDSRSYLRGLEDELGENSNGIRLELNRLTKAGLLSSETDGRLKYYQANQQHALFPELHSLVLKYTGIDQVIESILKNLGTVELALVTGDYALGRDSGIIDLTLVGHINTEYLNHLIRRTESLIRRQVRTQVLSPSEYYETTGSGQDPVLVLWKQASPDLRFKEFSHA